ncbi:MAG: hypothetical protein AB7V48_08065 [Sedimentibacter sp.]
MKRLNIILFILIVALLSSCEKSPQEPEGKNIENKKNLIVNESEPSKFTAQGKIIKIDDNGLHVQDGDKVDVYNVDPQRTKSLYIGEYVGINKLEGEKFDVVLDENHDYNVRVTSEGKEITRINGTVNQINEDSVTVSQGTGEIKLKKARDFDLQVGEQFIADYVELAGSNQMLKFYDEASKINVIVKEISRDTSGTMRIYALSHSNVEYDIMVGADSITNFIHSSLEPEDEIIVYPNNISGDVPALVDAKLILLNDDEK